MSEISVRERFEKFTAALPADESQTSDYQTACLLHEMDIVQAKKLHHFGLGIVLTAVAPHLPYFTEPDHDDFKMLLAKTYLDIEKFSDEPGITFDVVQQATRTLRAATAFAVEQGVIDTDSQVIRAIGLLADSQFTRREFDAPCSYEKLLVSIKEKVAGAMFAGASMVVESVSKKLRGAKSGAVDIDSYKGLADQLRRIIMAPRVGIVIYKMSGWDEHTFLTRNMHDELLGDIDIIGEHVIIDSDYQPDLSGYEPHPNTSDTWDKVAARCPAQHVRGMIQWAPRALLTACDIVAENPPLPRINYTNW